MKDLKNALTSYDEQSKKIVNLKESLSKDRNQLEGLTNDRTTEPARLRKLIAKVQTRIDDNEFDLDAYEVRLSDDVAAIRQSIGDVQDAFGDKQSAATAKRNDELAALYESNAVTGAVSELLSLWMVFPHDWDSFLTQLKLKYEPHTLLESIPNTYGSTLTSQLTEPTELTQAQRILEQHPVKRTEAQGLSVVYSDDEQTDDEAA